jgi:hypothetical protein
MCIIQILKNLLTYPHIGIIITVIGTICLAFSVRIIEQKGGGGFVEDGEGNRIKVIGGYIRRELFWIGLFLIAMGTIMQW